MKHTLPETDRKTVARGLQASLIELIDLALQSKQAHWNLKGPHFRPLHLELDEIVDDVRDWSDDVAERITALDVPADGRVIEIAEKSSLEPPKAGWVKDGEVVEMMDERLGTVAIGIRQRMEPMEPIDVISHDLLIGIVRGLEKHQWMVRSQIAG